MVSTVHTARSLASDTDSSSAYGGEGGPSLDRGPQPPTVSRPSSTHTAKSGSTQAADASLTGSTSSFIGRLVQSVKQRPAFNRSTTSDRNPGSANRGGGRSSRRGSGAATEAGGGAAGAPPVPPLPASVGAEPSRDTVRTDRKGKGKGASVILPITAEPSSTSPLPTPSPGKEKRDPFSRFRPRFKRSQSGGGLLATAESSNPPGSAPPPPVVEPKAATLPAPAPAPTKGHHRTSDPTAMASSPKRKVDASTSLPIPTREPLPTAPLTMSLASSLTAYLTQPALLTLAQLAPAQLLSLQAHEQPTSATLPFSDAEKAARAGGDTVDAGAAPTTEQLSASSLALPTTSIVGLWRLLKCVDWIREKEQDLSAVSLPGASNAPRTKETLSFDIANTLQNVGDILSSVSSAASVEMVFFHAFYSPRTESDATASLAGSRPPTSASTATTTDDDSSILVGAAAQGEGGMREISVKADERGLVIGLTCLLRQVLAQAKRGSTIEVGLHLTPLYAKLDASPTATDLGPPKSWKCIFDVALTTPSSSPTTSTFGSTDPSSAGIAFKNGARISAYPHSELPAIPGSQVTDTIFKYLGMQLTTGRITSRGHTWKITAVLPKGKAREPGEVGGKGKGCLTDNSREPTAEELSTFAETALKSRKVLLFAAEDSVFAKHVTCYLASWGTDMSHMPYDRSPLAVVESIPDPPPHPVPIRPKLDARSGLSRYDSGFGGSLQPSLVETPTAALLSPSVGGGNVGDPISATAAGGALGAGKSGEASPTSPSYDPTTHFIIIDDDVPTLRAQLLSLRNASPQMHLPLGGMAHLGGAKSRPSMTRRSKSSNQVVKAVPQHTTSILHFTSIARYSHVKEVVRSILESTQWFVLPDVLVLPKPVGPRRILTALHTAVRRPMIESSYLPIATSPSSPGSQYYASAVSRPSPALSAGAVQDFDSAAAAYNKTTPEAAAPETAGARTPPITVPGTPSIVPSPNVISHEAIEYFARAASESGGSASTGVVLQSPDGRPAAMFFHHAASSKRISSNRRDLTRENGISSTETNGKEGVTSDDFDSAAPVDVDVATSPQPGLGRTNSARGDRQMNGEPPVRAMTLDKFEAVSPDADSGSPQRSATPGATKSPPKPSLLRMPSVPASVASTPIHASPAAATPPASAISNKDGKAGSSPLRGPATAAAAEGGLQPSAPVPLRQGRRQSSTGTMRKRRAPKKPTQVIVPPVRVLIVEDNPINQTILAMYLRRKNVYHEIAKDGQQAIDKWRTGNFHLVLMDIQLPIKDGIQATKEIRQMERAANITGFASTPPADGTSPRLQAPILSPEATSPVTSPRNSSVIIVALTASSLDKDRDIALAAGCNDFLTKPVNLDWLNQKLLEWGSMAWLSGFSRPRFSNPPSEAAKSPSSPGGISSLMLSNGSIRFTTADKRSREVAEHLHLGPRPGTGGSQKGRVTELRNDGAGTAEPPTVSVQAATPRRRSFKLETDLDGPALAPGEEPLVTQVDSVSVTSSPNGAPTSGVLKEQRDEAVQAGAKEAELEEEERQEASGNAADSENTI